MILILRRSDIDCNCQGICPSLRLHISIEKKEPTSDQLRCAQIKSCLDASIVKYDRCWYNKKSNNVNPSKDGTLVMLPCENASNANRQQILCRDFDDASYMYLIVYLLVELKYLN